MRLERRSRAVLASATSRALLQMRSLIESNNLGPGTKLPSERVLAARFQVGRPAVREAIKALSILGLLESRRGDGTYVKSLAALQMDRTPSLETDFDLIELLELRKMFEPRAAALAAARATQKQLREVEKELLAQEAHLEDRRALERHDYLFHEAILRAAGNRMLIEVARCLAGPLRKSRETTAQTTPDVGRIVQQHRTIFNAIKRGEADLAEKAMLEHLQTVGLDLISGRKLA